MLIDARDLCRRFRLTDGTTLDAVAGVSLALEAGEAVGLVGASGSGKTTLGRLLLGLEPADAGTVRLDGVDLASLAGAARRSARRRLQPVPQDPGAALDPRQRVDAALAEPLRAHGLASRDLLPARVAGLLEMVGLGDELGRRFPHELSGGERQRVALARALAVEPALLVADEPLAHLDPASQAEVQELLVELRRRRGIALLLIGHDLEAVAWACSRLLVMTGGRIVEEGPSAAVLARPAHPYTRELVGAPAPGSALASALERVSAPGTEGAQVPAPQAAAAPRSGCSYAPFCVLAAPVCHSSPPPRREVSPGHIAACHGV